MSRLHIKQVFLQVSKVKLEDPVGQTQHAWIFSQCPTGAGLRTQRPKDETVRHMSSTGARAHRQPARLPRAEGRPDTRQGHWEPAPEEGERRGV